MSLPQLGAIIGDKYRVERLIGSGGMGAVFEVSHLVTGKHFAIKWLLPEVSTQPGAVKRFLREAQVAGRFEHPNVIEIYDIGQQGDSYYIVMELLQGESLADHLKRGGPLSVVETCEVLVPCIEGVAEAHKAGVIHRDIKPANIFLCSAVGRKSQTPKIVDFGIARLSSQPGQPDSTLTKSGTLIGTPHYMAPEQIRGADIDARVDVYAFGVVLYECLTGQLPFDGNSYADLVLSVFSSRPKAIASIRADVPAELSAIVDKAMARERDARYATLLELGAALAPFCSARPAPRAIVSTGERLDAAASERVHSTPFATDDKAISRAPARKRRAFIWGAYGLGLSLLVLTPWALYSRRSATEPTPQARPAAPSEPKLQAAAKLDQTPAAPQDDVHPNTRLIITEAPQNTSTADAGVRSLVSSAAPPVNEQSSQRLARTQRKLPKPPVPGVQPSASGNAAKSGIATEPSVAPRPFSPPRVSLGTSDFESHARDAGVPARPNTSLDHTGF